MKILTNTYKTAIARIKISDDTQLENILRKLDWNDKRLSIAGEYLNHLRFADDIVLLAQSPEELQQLIKVVLKMNLVRTKLVYQVDI